MKLKITCFSIDVAKKLQYAVKNEENYYNVKVLRRQEVAYLTFNSVDDYDKYLRCIQSRMGKLGYIQVERITPTGKGGSKSELILHKDDYVVAGLPPEIDIPIKNPTPHSGTIMNKLDPALPLAGTTRTILKNIKGIEWIVPPANPDEIKEGVFAGFRPSFLQLNTRPVYFEYIDNPYHNELHCRIVATIAESLGQYYNVHREDMALLELAAFLHDVGHSGGVMTDDHNINRVLHYIDNSPHVPELTEEATAKLKGLIRATEFPRNKDVEYTHLEKILQDADLLATSLCVDSTKYLMGLYEESLVKNPTLTLMDFHQQQVKFHDDCMRSLLNTVQAKAMMAEVMDDVLTDLYRHCEASVKKGEVLDADPDYDKAYRKVLKHIGKIFRGGATVFESKLADIGCKGVFADVMDPESISFMFQYKGHSGTLTMTEEYIDGITQVTSIQLELSLDDELNLKFLKRLAKALKK